jgi:DNA-binding SARP family transcriptional activator
MRGGVRLGRRRERCLLAILLLEAGSVVSADRLVDLLWDDDRTADRPRPVCPPTCRLRNQLDPDGTGALKGIYRRP